MIVALTQFDIAWNDSRANFETIRRLLRDHGPAQLDLLVLPEMFATGFGMDAPAAAESAGQAEQFLVEIAGRYGCRVLGGTVGIAAGGLGLNQAVMFAPSGAEELRYTKMHPFTFAGEAEHYAPGEAPVIAEMPAACPEPVDRGGPVNLSAFICYDLRFPEVFRAAAVAGAEVLAVIANWPACRADHWRALLRARAIENQACVVGVNRVGSDPKERYAGGSLVIDPRGEVIAGVGDGEAVITAELDIAALRRYRAEFPALGDARSGWIKRLD